MIKTFKAFTPEEVKFIIENYNTLTLLEIASKLNRNKMSVKYKIKKIKEGNASQYNMWTEKDEIFLRDNYMNHTYGYIGKILNKKSKSVRDKANYIGLYKFTNKIKDRECSDTLICTTCKEKFPNTREYFNIRRNSDNKVLDATCKNCAKIRRGNRDSVLESFCKTLIKSSKIGAKSRKLSHNINFEDTVIKYHEQGGLCALTKIPLTHIRGKGRIFTNISLDRIDSKKDYTKDNTQIVCLWANYAKQEMSDDQLKEFIKISYENLYLK